MRIGKYRSLIAIASLLMLAANLIQGQSSSSSDNGPQQPIPLSHLYWHFLNHQAHLDKVAAQREKQGKDGNWLRNYYQQKLGFNDSEFSLVRDSATRLQSQLKQIDDEVQSIVQKERASHPRSLATPGDLPPVPPRLYELAQQHEDVINNEVNTLKSELGVNDSAKLDMFLQLQFAPNVRVQHVGPSKAPTSSHPVSPFPTEVQP